MNPKINIGDVLTCTETGKKFTAEQDGLTTNYALDSEGRVYSDEGVNLCERRQLLDRSKPFHAYVSCDGDRITGWKGNVLGTVEASWKVKLTRPSFVHGKDYSHFRVKDVHGAMWQGRGSPGFAIKLRPIKGTAP